MNKNQSADEFAEKINSIIGIQNACQWCKYSKAWFVYLPLEMGGISKKIAELFGNAGCKQVITGLSADEEQIQVSAYV